MSMWVMLYSPELSDAITTNSTGLPVDATTGSFVSPSTKTFWLIVIESSANVGGIESPPLPPGSLDPPTANCAEANGTADIRIIPNIIMVILDKVLPRIIFVIIQ